MTAGAWGAGRSYASAGSNSLARRLEHLRDAVLGEGPSKHTSCKFELDPYELAHQVLAYCRKDLGLRAETRLEWQDLPDDWGVVYAEQPHVILLSRRLLSKPAQLVDTVAHECKHASRILHGLTDYDAAAERAATDYGRTVAARWRFL